MAAADPPRPTDAELRAAAGSAGHGRVLLRGDLGRVTTAVVDTNGDDAFLACVVLHLDDDGTWRETAWNDAALLSAEWTHGVALVHGRAAGASSVALPFRGQVRHVPVNRDGWWIFLAEAAENEPLPWPDGTLSP